MTDYGDLKRLAEACLGEWYEYGELRCEDRSGYINGLHHDDEYFIAAANPAAVLALIAENERLERKNDNQAQTIREYSDLVMGGDVSLGMLRADLRVTSGERDQLKAEVEVLRKDAERYRWLRGDTSAGKVDFCIMRKHWRADELSEVLTLDGADQQIDAAMSKDASHD